jgi:hypothetical protein
MLRFTASYNSSQNTVYRIYIYDREFSGTATEVITDGGILTNEGDKDDPLKRIHPQKFEFTLLLNENSYSDTLKDDLVDFYVQLTQNPEGRFYLVFRQMLPLGSKLLFRGKILPDVGDLTLNYWKEVKLTAVCGLSDLKNIEYRPTEYTDNEPLYSNDLIAFKRHFVDLLMKSETNQFFYVDTALNGTADNLMYNAIHWTESLQTGGNAWNLIGIKNMFFEQKTPSYRTYQNCEEVLTKIMNGFNARIISDSGIYKIEQLSYLDNATVTRYGYKYDGNTALGSIDNKPTYNITTNAGCVLLTNPTIKTIPGFKAVELVQANKMENYLDGFSIQWPTTPGPHNFGYVISEGQQMGLALIFDVKTDNPAFLLDAWDFVLIEYEVKIGDLYLRSLANPGNPVSAGYDFVNKGNNNGQPGLIQIGSFEWTLIPSTIKIVYNTGPTKFATLSEIKQWIYYAGSLEVPGSGELVITLLPPKILYVDLTVNTAKTADLESAEILKGSRIIIGPNGYGNLSELPDKFSIFQIGDTRNTLVHKTEFPFFDSPFIDGDAIKTLQFGMLYMGGFFPVPTVEWTDPDSAETLPLQKLTMKSILSMRRNPTWVKNIRLHIKDKQTLTYDHRFVLNGEVLIPLHMQHDTTEDIYSLSLWKVEKDFEGINIVESNDPLPTPTPQNYTDESVRVIGGRFNVYFAKVIASTERISFDGLTEFGEGFVERAKAFYTYNELRKRFFVTAGGIEQDYIEPDDPLPALGPDEFTLDETTNEMVFWMMNPDTKVVIKFFD